MIRDSATSPATPSFQPLYLQIKALLVQSLAAGEWSPGEAIPSRARSRRALRRVAGTVRKAIDALAADNLVVRRQGKGTFVATHTEEAQSTFRFLRVRADDGHDEYPASRLLDVRRGKAVAEIARLLELKAGDPVVVDQARARMGRQAGRARRDHAARRAVPRPHAGEARRVSRVDVRLFRDAVRRSHAERAGAPQGGAGGCGGRSGARRRAPASPLLAVERVAFTFGGRPVELRGAGLCSDACAHHYANAIGEATASASRAAPRYNFLLRTNPAVIARGPREDRSADFDPFRLPMPDARSDDRAAALSRGSTP